MKEAEIEVTTCTKTDVMRYADILAQRFGVLPERIIEVQGGWSAKAFRVETTPHIYFLKVYDRSEQSVLPWIERIDSYIHVEGYLAGVPELCGRIVAPVCALDGGYKAEDGDNVFLLFDYVEGFTPGIGKLTRAQVRELAEILAHLHEIGTEIPVNTDGLTEDISLWFGEKLRTLLDTEGQGGLSSMLKPRETMLRTAVNEMFRLRDEVRVKAKEICLCHTDAHGNNVIQGKRLVLADWEGLCLAPPEADLFMYAGEVWWDEFWDAYQMARPGFALNAPMLHFYLIRRQIEDIWYDLIRLLYDHPDEEEIAELHSRIGQISEKTEQLLAAGY